MATREESRGNILAAENAMVVADDVPKKTPNDLLAEEISDALLAAGLVPVNRKDNLLSKLKVGGVTQDDWGLWVDLASAPKGTAGEACNE